MDCRLFVTKKGKLSEGAEALWTLFYPQAYHSHLFDLNSKTADLFISELAVIIEQTQGHAQKHGSLCYRRQFQIGGSYFLLAFDFKAHLVAIFSPKLSQELLMIKSSGKITEEERHIIKWAATMDSEQFPLEIERISALRNFDDFSESYPEAEQNLRKLLMLIGEYRPAFLEKINDFILNLLAQYDLLRLPLLRFLSVLPQLTFSRGDDEVKKLFLESLREMLTAQKEAQRHHRTGTRAPLPALMITLVRLASYVVIVLPASFLDWMMKKGVLVFAQRFIVGENIREARGALMGLSKSGRMATLDLLGELVLNESEAENYASGVIQMMEEYKAILSATASSSFSSSMPPTLSALGISIKVSALSARFSPDPKDEEKTYQLVAPKLKRILLRGKELGAFITVDAEHYRYRDIVFRLYKRVLLETPELHDYKETGIVLQAYLRDGYNHFLEILELAKLRQINMPVRLVKGAYWDSETVEFKHLGLDPMQFLNKEESDLHFRHLTYEMLKNGEWITLCLASHNFSEHALSESMRMRFFPNAPTIEHQCLHMTCEALSKSLAQLGWTVRDYVPIGNLMIGMGYLVRRIMENSSQVGFLTAMRSQKNQTTFVPAEKILQQKREKGTIARYESEEIVTSDFFPLPPTQGSDLIDMIRYYSYQQAVTTTSTTTSTTDTTALLWTDLPRRKTDVVKACGLFVAALSQGWKVIWSGPTSYKETYYDEITKHLRGAGFDQSQYAFSFAAANPESLLELQKNPNIKLKLCVGELPSLLQDRNTSYSEMIRMRSERMASVITQSGELGPAIQDILNVLVEFGRGVKIVLVQEGLYQSALKKLSTVLEELEPIRCFHDENEKERQLFIQQVERAREECMELGGTFLVDRAYDVSGHSVGPVMIELDYEKALKESDMLRAQSVGPLFYVVKFGMLSEAIKILHSLGGIDALSFWGQSTQEGEQFQKEIQSHLIFMNKPIQFSVGLTGFLTTLGESIGGPDLPFALRLKEFSDSHPLQHLEKGEGEIQKEDGNDEVFPIYNGQDLNPLEVLEEILIGLSKWGDALPRLKGDVAEDERAVLKEARKWLLGNQHLLVNVWRRKRGIVLASSRTPSPEIMLYVVSALLNGGPLTVFAHNQVAYNYWSKVVSFFQKENSSLFQVYFPTQKVIESLFSMRPVDFCIAEGGQSEMIALASQLLSKYDQFELDRLLLSQKSAPSGYSLEKYLQQLRYHKLVAV